MKQIELQYTDEVNVDMLESIVRRYFSDKQIKRQNWGVNAPFLRIKMSFWIEVIVAISRKEGKNKTVVLVNDGYTMGAWLLLGWPAYFMFKKNHRENVMNAIRAELMHNTNVVFLN